MGYIGLYVPTNAHIQSNNHEKKQLSYYTAIHLRINELDQMAFGLNKTIYNGYFHNIKKILMSSKMSPKMIYIAGGNTININILEKYISKEDFNIVTKYDFLSAKELKFLKEIPARLSIFDFLISQYSSIFLGFSKSTFSSIIYLNHLKSKKKMYFYDSNVTSSPPWQILLNIDPNFKYFHKNKPINLKEILEDDMKMKVGIW